MATTIKFELHTLSREEVNFSAITKRPQAAEPGRQVFSVSPGQPLRLGVDTGATPPLVEVGAGDEAVAEFQIVSRALGPALVMIAESAGILVNGLPALELTILTLRDVIRLAPGVATFVTERVTPFVGKPPQEMLGQKCPYCKIPIEEGTRVFIHHCGVPLHAESAESHPDVPEEDRLNCVASVRLCLSCSRPIFLEESLLWDPANA